MGPVAVRPELPPGYGSEGPWEPLRWSRVEEWIAAEHHYWLCTLRADGRPHVKPVWAFWDAGVLLFSTHPRSVAGRNLAARPGVSVHLESSERVAILEGTVERLRDRELLRPIARLEQEKYDWPGGDDPDPDDPDHAYYRLQPSRVLAWDGAARIGRTITRFEPRAARRAE